MKKYDKSFYIETTLNLLFLVSQKIKLLEDLNEEEIDMIIGGERYYKERLKRLRENYINWYDYYKSLIRDPLWKEREMKSLRDEIIKSLL